MIMNISALPLSAVPQAAPGPPPPGTEGLAPKASWLMAAYTMLEAICQREKSERRDIQARLLVLRCSSDHLEALTPHRPYHCSTQARDKTVWLMPNPMTATHSPDRPLCGGEPSMPQVYVVEAF